MEDPARAEHNKLTTQPSQPAMQCESSVTKATLIP